MTDEQMVEQFETAAEKVAGRVENLRESEALAFALDAVPDLDPEVQAQIENDPDVFVRRVNDYAYARAMSELNLPADSIECTR